MSDHSAEYAVVNAAAKTLRRHCARVTPIYFWASYEGQILGDLVLSGRGTRLVAIFPRRPRVAEGRVYFKVHASIVAYAREAAEFGLPTLCGVPIVESLADYHADSPCAFFAIDGFGRNDGVDRLYSLNLRSPNVDGGESDSVRGPLDASCLLYTSPSPRDRQKSRMPSSA